MLETCSFRKQEMMDEQCCSWINIIPFPSLIPDLLQNLSLQKQYHCILQLASGGPSLCQHSLWPLPARTRGSMLPLMHIKNASFLGSCFTAVSAAVGKGGRLCWVSGRRLEALVPPQGFSEGRLCSAALIALGGETERSSAGRKIINTDIRAKAFLMLEALRPPGGRRSKSW